MSSNYKLEATSSAPTGLLCDLLEYPEKTDISNRKPTFGWIIGGSHTQTAYQIKVGLDQNTLAESDAVWDTGKVTSSASINLPYQGSPLQPGETYSWTVRIWQDTETPTPWASPQTFTLNKLAGDDSVSTYPLEVVKVYPALCQQANSGTSWFIDFERAAFGWLELELESQEDGIEVRVELGESRHGDVIDRKPPGSVRYTECFVQLKKGRHRYRVNTPADARNTGPRAIPIPTELGVILPFRFAMVSGENHAFTLHEACLHRVEYPFNPTAATFESSDQSLNAIWDLCHHTIRATTFAGYYVDGDRERIPYEADAYINQLSHYAVDREFSLARRTHEYLLEHPTWPTEWKQHSILIAWADYEATGDLRSLQRHYETLKQEKLLLQYAREDGLLATGHLRDSASGQTDVGDLVDWPIAERDGFDFRDVNSVVNAFHYRTLVLMAKIASVLKKEADATTFADLAQRIYKRFNQCLFDTKRGVYVDGEGSRHVSQHGNLFPLAMGLVPAKHKASVAAYVKSRGVACSVYAAQYLLEGLFAAGEDQHAIGLISGGGLRSWRNMLNNNATITWEAWDQSLKPNQDWNHAWATAPLNLCAKYVLGVQPIEPGFSHVRIVPQLGNLSYAKGRVPTIRGPIEVSAWKTNGKIEIDVSIPAGVQRIS